jgi:diaminopimelate epimerase
VLTLNFPTYSFRIKNKENKPLIFDEVRKKFVPLQAEEWVRQHCLQFLIREKKYPKSLMCVEKEIQIGSVKNRYDIAVYGADQKVKIVVECKAPHVKITQNSFDQIARYNFKLDAKYLMVTNGINHYYCYVDLKKKKYVFLKDLPVYAN